MNKVNRNDPCPCGSGVKYKKCCGLKEGGRTKSRLGAASVFSQAGGVKKNPSVNLAQRVFKVLTAASNPLEAAPKKEEESEGSITKGYTSLEELIGIEGAPTAEPSPPQGQG